MLRDSEDPVLQPTEQKRIEPNRSEQPGLDFRALFEVLPGRYLVLLPDDPRFTIAAVNAAYARATMTTPEEIAGLGVFDVFPDNPDEPHATGVKNLAASLRRVLRTKSPDTMAPQKYDIRRPGSEGGGFEERYWSPVNSPLLDAEGNVRFIIHRVEDITDFLRLKRMETENGRLAEAERERVERVEAELFLRSRELAQVKELMQDRQLLSLLVEYSPEFMGIADLQGVPVYANRSAIDLIGARGLEEIQNTPLPDCFVPGERAFVRDVVLPAVLEQGRWQGELHFRHLRTEEPIPVYYDIFRVDGPGGTATHLATITRDLRERKRALEELRESEKRFSIAFAQAPIGMVLTSPHGVILDANRAFLDMLGYTFEELQAHDSSHYTHPEDISRTREFYAHLREHNRAPSAFEKRYIRKDGQIVWARASGAMRCDEKGRATQLIAIVEDITDRKRAEEELQRSNGELKRANRELEEFAFVASHDLQEPLRMVNIYTQIILDSLGPEGSKLSQFAGFVTQGVSRMEALIRDLLTFSRTVQEDEQAAGTADLSASLTEALSVLENVIAESGAVITADALPSVRGDTAQMAHVFQNFISNALKYRKEGIAPEIRISAERSAGSWIISVRDNGIGFEQQYAERIFGLFKRLHKEDYPGTGLGLAICKRIVERYGGRIWAEGKPGEGAAFHFSLLPAETVGE
ncbi:MAG TPA: PAS domain S-box protein [Bryobacteraceae bacterium]|jgi:PAS domain S-box-containing protein